LAHLACLRDTRYRCLVRFGAGLKDWCRGHGTQLRMQDEHV